MSKKPECFSRNDVASLRMARSMLAEVRRQPKNNSPVHSSLSSSSGLATRDDLDSFWAQKAHKRTPPQMVSWAECGQGVANCDGTKPAGLDYYVQLNKQITTREYALIKEAKAYAKEHPDEVTVTRL